MYISYINLLKEFEDYKSGTEYKEKINMPT